MINTVRVLLQANKQIFLPAVVKGPGNLQKFLARNMSSASSFVLREIDGDLFSAPKEYSLAHCVGADMAMGAGIAVKFRQIYQQVDELLDQNVSTGGAAVLKDEDRFIYYLVTKQYSYEKPTYDSLRSSLIDMRNHMIQNDIKKLAIPKIGCGIDGLEWDKVQAELKKVFEKENVEITVYNFVPK
ncbi:ADP-ribose glycohydrolase OARD1-like [Condylostylus longicornis]|uniref:ADP-ribose glycohydrolase OARD1-like n=1 Tax=Condylostylus longicornis TaxID=2530218 RepID=UPI00244DDB65|nr:ADP-ribose glycohydrolase OARD1-like [Condylostylus longicornis]